jgi:endo-1,3(4)-beta-glucanase
MSVSVGKGEDPIGLYPYAVKCLETGVHVSYPASRRHVTQITIFDDFVSDFQLSSLEEYSSRSVESHDFASVTMNYRTMTGQGYKTPLVKGSTFVTVVYTQSTPVISSSLMHLVSIEKKVIPGSKGTQYIITLGNWQKWLLYCSEPIDFIQDKDTLSSPNPITGFIRLAVLSPFSTTAMSTLMNFVAKYPIGASISFSYPASTSSAIVTYEFKTVGSGPLLMFRLPHHAGVMVSPSSNEETKMTQVAISPMYCIKGKLQVVIGETWRLKYSLPKIGFNYDAPGFAGVDKKQQMEISKSLRDDIRTVPSSMDDPYHFGKEIGRMALLAIIAEEIGDLESKMAAVTALEKALVLWLTGANVDVLVYDSTYGGVVPSLGLKNKYSDYGAGWYSDHHFHFGYFVFAAAVISKLDAKFADQYRAQLDTLVRDFCTMNPSDKEFPLVRHKDFFDGHSWASGLYTQANGKGQESSSEAVNAYYGVYLYAKVTNKGDLMNFAHLMLAMEVQATKVYWHMKSDSNIYDSLFAAGKMVGNIGALDVTTTTWFGSELEFVHGINM